MSIKLCCSLCCTPSSEYNILQNEMGEFNEVYKITVQYFDPMLLSDEENNKYPQENKVLCQECWMPIKEFYEFQQNVIRTRSLLEKSDVKQLAVVKIEDDDEDVTSYNNNKSGGDDGDDGDDDEKDDYRFENVFVKYDLEAYDENSESTNDEDDEKPLSTLINKSLMKPNNTTEIVQERNNEIIDKTEIIKNEGRKIKRRGRKPKSSMLEELLSDNNEKNNTVSKQYCTQKKKMKLDGENKKDKGKSALNLEKARESDVFIAKWKPVLECDLCDETSSSFDKLRSHFKERHKCRFYIKCCERKFYRRYVLANHIQLHLNPETHKCDICGKVSANKNNLKLHKRLLHEKIEKLECKICHKLFNLKTSLDRHLLTHVTGDKKFSCQECGKAYVLEVQLKSHIKTAHNVDRVCDQCGKTLHGVHALKKHLMEHAGIEKIKFPCDECGVKLNSRNGLKRHKAAYHHDGSTIYVCKICGKVAASENALLNHKKYVHEEERKHKCSYCNKAFKRSKNLLEHIASHTGQDLYQCPYCPQTFKVNANMYHHRKKVHPVEWKEGRKNRLQVPKVDINHIKNQIVL